MELKNMNPIAKAAVCGAIFLFFGSSEASASPISDPAKFCHAVADAVMATNAEMATTVAIANEPDKSREDAIKAAMGTMVNTTKLLNPDGSLKFSELSQERR